MKLLLSVCFLLTASLSYGKDGKCVKIYHEGLKDLELATKEFNNRYISKEEFVFKVSKISTEVSAVRSVCHFIEDPETKSCVKSLKERYKKLRNKISLPAIIVENQTEVSTTALGELYDEYKNGITSISCGLKGLRL